MATSHVKWLHLTDLHVGLEPERWLWPNVEEAVINDLRRLHDQTGPWDIVFFTGDVTQSGLSAQFVTATEVLDRIQSALNEVGSHPVTLCVPGNHDLSRPARFSGITALSRSWHLDTALREDFWNTPSNELRGGVEAAFHGWQIWSANPPAGVEYRSGLLPGDFSCSLRVRDLMIGVVGLNSAFLQLEGGDFRRKVTLDARQLDAVCVEGGAAWSRTHDCTFLLTHHPPDWLDTSGASALHNEISPAGRFTAHLFGHQHQGRATISIASGGQPRCEILGKSLFGMESWGEPGDEHGRLHGYSVGCLSVDDTSRLLRLWPREGRLRQSGGWHITPDHSVDLADDNGTEPINLGPSPVGSTRTAGNRTTLSPPFFSATEEPLPGWRAINNQFLDERTTPLTSEALSLYFDGAIPGWAHAVTDQIPRRPVVGTFTAAIEAAISAGTCRAVALLDPGGEGKSTALLQAAADLARMPRVNVMWRSQSDTPLDPAAVLGLPPGPWVLCSDDAESIALPTFRSLQLCQVEDRRDIFFALAARDTDWRFRKANRLSWGTLLERCALGQLDEPEALQIVTAWSSAGLSELRELRELSDDQSRALRLIQLARSSTGRSSFFGAVLHARFSPVGLQSHVQTVLERLAEHPIGRYTLSDAFLMVAALEAVGVEGLHRRVLADLLSMPMDRIGSNVLRQLGEEAAAVMAGDFITTRHPDIAVSAIVVGEETQTGADLAALYARIVRRTVLTNRAYPLGYGPWFGSVLNVGKRIAMSLPQRQFSPDRRAEIALAAALADCEVEPTRLSAVVSVGRTFRALDRSLDAISFLRKYVDRFDEFEDYHESIRGFWLEWAVCAGRANDPTTNVVLAALSISNNLSPARLTDRNRSLGLAGLGVAFTELLKIDASPILMRGLRAVAVFGPRFSENDPVGLRYFDIYDQTANSYGMVTPVDNEEALEWLRAAVCYIAARWDDFINVDCELDDVSFSLLTD